MPWYISLYIALLVISLPVGVSVLRRLENDWLHPVGGTLSTLLSVMFVISFWLPDLVPLRGSSTLLMYTFVLLWDAYLLVHLRSRLADLYQLLDEPDVEFEPASFLVGALLMLPAYVFGALVCLRAFS